MQRVMMAAIVLATLAVPAAAAPAPLAAQPQPPPPQSDAEAPASSQVLALEAGSGKVLTLVSPAANVFVADPKIAEVRPASATNLFIFGLASGRTTIAAMDSTGRVVAHYDVTVRPSSFAAREVESAVARLLPNSHVKVQTQIKGMQLLGSVKNPSDAAQAMAIAKGFAPEGAVIDNALTIDSPIQVTLQVRVAQMSRSVVRNMGVNWQAIANFGSIATLFPALQVNINGAQFKTGDGGPPGQGAAFNSVINALAQDNLAHILAEPNLTVMSGQAASFQVGGEFPIPVAQEQGRITVGYKNYGVMLNFVPTVLSDGRIDLHVKPEVSELSFQGGLTLTAGNASLTVPSLIVRRADTTVQLGSGQSFAIAGLLEQQTSDGGSGLPGLGDIPVVGSLFRNSNLNRTEQELVIVVTPYIVRPVNDPATLKLPTAGYNTPSDIERLLLMKQVAADRPPVPIRIPGDAGFIIQ